MTSTWHTLNITLSQKYKDTHRFGGIPRNREKQYKWQNQNDETEKEW